MAPLIGRLIKDKIKCPATILAASRTLKVRGRIKFLINSIITIKGISAKGVPNGTKCAKKLPRLKNEEYNTYPSHIGKANLRENTKWELPVNT